MKIVTKMVAKACEIIGALLLGILAVTIFLQVFFRYIVGQSLGWTTEFGTYFMIIIAFFSSVAVLYEGKHIAIKILVNKLKEPWINITNIIGYLVTLAFVLVLFYYGINLVEKTIDSTTVSLNVSRGLIFSSVPITAFGMALVLINSIIEELRNVIKFYSSKKEVT